MPWALHAGVGYAINERLKLEASYRYLNTGTFTSNPIACEASAGCFYERQSFKEQTHDMFQRILHDKKRDCVPAMGAIIQENIIGQVA